ncbi:GNAT family protein [Pseudophaeobacter sp.]|uniref:GNAT family N-acetyltransferase n=1 Tax=Pseudophaeobacter sp. TaxID=1971739 RepID=UPI0032992C0D
MPISLRPVSPEDFDLVCHIQVEADQILFSGTVAQAFAANEEGVDFHAILDQDRPDHDRPVGFFKLDWLFHQQYGFAQANELGLRAFMIDRRHQGKGVATAAVRTLKSYIPGLYPSHKAVVLTVNMQNVPAIRCYKAGGFVDTGDIYPHGMAGPQHIMRLDL